jgi:hypothetical protein
MTTIMMTFSGFTRLVNAISVKTSFAMTIIHSTLGIASKPSMPTIADSTLVTGYGWHLRLVPFRLSFHPPTATFQTQHGLSDGKRIGQLFSHYYKEAMVRWNGNKLFVIDQH